MNVMIVVTHLLGSGHLSRALALAQAFGKAGHRVTLVSGGLPAQHLEADGIDFVQLPPVQSDGVDFSRLLDANGDPVSTDISADRIALLLAQMHRIRPDVIITELFPFGRRILKEEFCALLDASKQMSPRPLVLASIRDILAPPSKPAKAEMAHAIVDTYYDAVLVHSDPDVTPLDISWPVNQGLARKLHYTGFIASRAGGKEAVPQASGEILVSTGGGNVAPKLYETAIAAAVLAQDLRWRLFVAGSHADARLCELQTRAPSKVTVQRATPAFRGMLKDAMASVSLCGYNTALDILRAGTPCVFVPFDAGGETEQSLRAATLAPRDGVRVLPSSEMSPNALIENLRAVIAAPRRTPMTHNIQGAARSVDIVETLIERHTP